MSTNNIVPNADTMQDPSYGVASAPSSSVNVSQTPAPVPDAPGPVNGPSRLNSVLARIVGIPTPTPVNASQPSASSGGVASTNDDASSSGQPSGWKSALGKVASVVSTGLSGIPESRRPGFVEGLGSGARANQAAVAQQQAIKFKSFDDQVRLAELHNQDLKMQNDTQAQTDAHTKAELDNRALANSLGINYDTIASHGPTVMDHLAAQTAANGAASVPSGTHLTGDGEGINIPQDTQKTRDGQMQMYNLLSGPLGLPPLPNGGKGMDFVPPTNMKMLMNKVNGFENDGSTLKHEELPGAIGALQFKRDALSKSGTSDSQLQAVDNRLGVLKANLNALDTHEASVKQSDAQATINAQNSPESIAAETKKSAATKQAQLDVENSPSNQAAAARGAAQKAQAEEQAKGNDNLVVAYHPGYDNGDGTKGANVVMTKGDAQVQGLQHYKADPAKLNATIAGFNDVQNKINMLADVAANPDKMSAVQPQVAADMLRHGHGIEIGAFGSKIDTSTIDADLARADSAMANQATRDFVTATAAAREAITQLPRLQTFGQSSRMTQQQMESAQKMLPAPGDDAGMAKQKMTALQTTIDPLRKQLPHMQGAESMPSWMEKQGGQQQAAPSTPTSVGRFNPQTQTIDYANIP
jgi:hypothetical protein